MKKLGIRTFAPSAVFHQIPPTLAAAGLALALLAQPAGVLGQTKTGNSERTLLDDTSEAGFQSIFNGQDLAGWEGNPKLWSVKDGAITGQTTAENPAPGNTFLIWTNGTVADFELRCSFKLVPGDAKGFANSGIQYRSKVTDPRQWVVGGYQADMEAGPSYTGILYFQSLQNGRTIILPLPWKRWDFTEIIKLLHCGQQDIVTKLDIIHINTATVSWPESIT